MSTGRTLVEHKDHARAILFINPFVLVLRVYGCSDYCITSSVAINPLFWPIAAAQETRDCHVKFELQEPGGRYEGGEEAGASKQNQVPMNFVLASGRTRQPTNS